MIKKIVIIGAGTMGRGIAQWFAQNEVSVELCDIQRESTQSAIDIILNSWRKLSQKNKFTSNEVLNFQNNLSGVDFENHSRDPDLVIEAIVENFDIKTQLFKELDQKLSKKTILASNTSSFPISALAQNLSPARQEKFIGLHFFNPATIMKLVEVIKGSYTLEKVSNDLIEWFDSKSKKPVCCADSPGFIVNRVARNFYGESLKMASHFSPTRFSEIDSVIRTVGGFKMGPFELMDLIGIDVNYSVTQSVWKNFFYHPRFSPHQLQRQMVESRQLGLKSKKGFLEGQTFQAQTQNTKKMSSHKRLKTLILIEHKHPFLKILEDLDYPLIILKDGSEDGLELEQFSQKFFSTDLVFDLISSHTQNKKSLLTKLSTLFQGPIVTEMSSLWGEGIATEFSQIKAGVSLSFYSPTHEHEYWVQKSDSIIHHEILTLFSDLKIRGQIISNPGLGMIYPRVISMIINEAYLALEEGVSSQKDIDMAMKFGVNYPLGPFEWSEKIGEKSIVTLLDDLRSITGNSRYEISLQLKLKAQGLGDNI